MHHSLSYKKKAKELVESGKMNGYLVYDGTKLVGWCNTDRKNLTHGLAQIRTMMCRERQAVRKGGLYLD